MVTLKNIFAYYKNAYNNAPRGPQNLTPLQQLEWLEQKSAALQKKSKEYWDVVKNRSFVGELFVSSPARIEVINKGYLIVGAMYANPNNSLYNELVVHYELLYDNSLYKTIRLFNLGDAVKFEGTIMEFKYHGFTNYIGSYEQNYSIKLNLSTIRKIGKSNRIDSLPTFVPAPKFHLNRTECFIATAAFGNQEVTEVLELRNWRDKVLTRTFVGQILIKTYYLISPPIAFVIKQSNFLRKLTRFFLKNIFIPIIKIR